MSEADLFSVAVESSLSAGGRIVNSALTAFTLEDATGVQKMISDSVGDCHQRPLGDRWNNHGLISGAGGSYDIKLIENITNMQDAILEAAVYARYGLDPETDFSSPREAAEGLLSGVPYRELGERCTVIFRESDPPAKRSKRLTAVFRDQGCGMTPQQIPRTIFALGSGHKEDVPWLQGAFGLGGETTYRNAHAVILVTRRRPELLGLGEEDRISVAVLLWEKHLKGKSAYYLVSTKWKEPGDQAVPFSIPAAEFSEFAPGTHLALISYGVEGLHRAREGGDEKSFEAIVNTRLFSPITPVRFTNELLAGRRDKNLFFRGLARRLRDNPSKDRKTGAETLPFAVAGSTYHLPIVFHTFPGRGAAGERRNFMARDHSVIFTSNGQVHYHWTPAEFKNKTRHAKLYNRIFVAVETDALPIDIRTSLFTADRSELVRTDAAVRLEDSVVAFINEWEDLKAINADLIREALSYGQRKQSTLAIAKRISQALAAKGFSLGKGGGFGGQGNVTKPSKHKKIKLLKDPTELAGPRRAIAVLGETKFLNFILNTEDGFFDQRGELDFSTSPDGFPASAFCHGGLREGRFRLSIAVPDCLDPGVYKLEVVLGDWLKCGGGVGPTLSWETVLELVEERPSGKPGAGADAGNSGADAGGNVALVWSSHDDPDRQAEWTARTVGAVEQIPAEVLADRREEYAMLAPLGDEPIPTIVLNEHYHLLKKYLAARAVSVASSTLDQKRERYAVGTGVGLLMMFGADRQKEDLSHEAIRRFGEAIGRSVLTMMPEFDKLAAEAGIEGGDED